MSWVTTADSGTDAPPSAGLDGVRSRSCGPMRPTRRLRPSRRPRLLSSRKLNRRHLLFRLREIPLTRLAIPPTPIPSPHRYRGSRKRGPTGPPDATMIHSSRPIRPVPPPAPRAHPRRLRSRGRSRALELLIGGRIMAVVGGVIVILAGLFFAKLAYDSGWIGRIPAIVRALLLAGFRRRPAGGGRGSFIDDSARPAAIGPFLAGARHPLRRRLGLGHHPRTVRSARFRSSRWGWSRSWEYSSRPGRARWRSASRASPPARSRRTSPVGDGGPAGARALSDRLAGGRVRRRLDSTPTVPPHPPSPPSRSSSSPRSPGCSSRSTRGTSRCS